MAKRTNDLDSILNEIGQFGAFQILSCFLICLPIIFNGFDTLSYIFTASSVEQRCWISECDSSDNSSVYWPWWLNKSVPFENGIPSKCSRYGSVNISTIIDNRTEFCPADLFNTSNIVSCHNFIYKTNERTIATEWDLSCPENEWQLTLVGTLNNVGQFIGMPLGGYISDRYGRRTLVALAGTISAIMGIIRSFSVSYAMFVSFEVLDAAIGSIVYPAAMVLGMELVGPNKRVLASTILAVFYPVGEVIMGVVAKHVPNWRVFLRVLYIPGLLHILFFWIVTESVRWLLAQGKFDEAIKALKRAAKFNKVSIKDDALEELCSNSSESEEDLNKSYPIRYAFKSSTLLIRIINCSFCWFTNTLVYYGLSLNSVSLAGDKYLNFILVCLIEVPGFFICYFTTNLLGRRPSQSGSLILCGIAILCSFFVSDEQPWLGFVLFLVGKLAITISFTVLYVYTSELFPTNLRQSLLSFCSMFGRIGSMIAPQTPLIAQYIPSLPLILFGSCAILSGLLVLKFPETLNTRLPTTISDAENIGKASNKEETL